MQSEDYGAAPHIHDRSSVAAVMRDVLYALLPGTLLACWWFGWGLLLNLLAAVVAALLCEALALRLRGRAVAPGLADGSAVVTAWLLALCLSPLAPWWLAASGAAFAVLAAKHLYGGLGHNPFNPAMAGYVFVLLAFPAAMAFWPPPRGVEMDAVSGATPLAYLQAGLAGGGMVTELEESPLFGRIGGHGWEWLSLAWLLGGGWLLWRKTIAWRIPCAVSLGLFLAASAFYLYDADRFPSPLFHLGTGGIVLCAFFIATDPVSAAATPRGQWLYGTGIGVLAWALRAWGGYPDGIAFAVLLMNAAVPWIDRRTRPRVLGGT